MILGLFDYHRGEARACPVIGALVINIEISVEWCVRLPREKTKRRELLSRVSLAPFERQQLFASHLVNFHGSITFILLHLLVLGQVLLIPHNLVAAGCTIIIFSTQQSQGK